MCGICGIWGLALEDRNRYVNGMLDTLYHRGPDEAGGYSDADISLGIKRLSVIDLSTGSQPIFNEDRSLILICNGEIYNFYKLREGLIEKGHRFYTNSDLEVLVHLFEERGTDCLRYIKGMFAFALWDKNNKAIFIARDRFGIKPLYYYNKNGILAFSSELKSLLKLSFISKELDLRAMDLYFSLEYVPSPCSIFKDIYKLRPAHYISYKSNKLNIQRYWDLSDVPVGNKFSHSQAKDRLRSYLSDSIKEHLISDVPLGFFLSGGIDSSIIVALAKEMHNHDLHTFSIGFWEKSFDESKYSQIVSTYLGTIHHSYIFTIDNCINEFDNVIKALDEPFADTSIFPTYMLSKLSSKNIKVALSGEGADELFMGYPTHIAHRYANLFTKLPDNLKRPIEYLVNLLPISLEYFSLDFKLKQFVKSIYEHDYIFRHILWMSSFTDSEKEHLFSKNIPKYDFGEMSTVNSFIMSLVKNINTKEKSKLIQYLDIFTYLSEDLLVKSDRAGMLSSLEIRLPYLDHQLAEFVWSLETKLIYQKRLLREVFKGSLPKEILSRTKRGFAIPLAFWLKNKNFLKLIDEFFDASYIAKQGIFNPEYINSLFKQHLSGKKDNSKKIRTYMMFQSWYKNWYS